MEPSRPGWFRWLLLIVAFILGAAITLSEPAVTVLGEQLEEITNGHIRKFTIRMTRYRYWFCLFARDVKDIDRD